jgi:hypothetical protein
VGFNSGSPAADTKRGMELLVIVAVTMLAWLASMEIGARDVPADEDDSDSD